MACLEEPVEGGTWLLENSIVRPAGVIAARALVHTTSDGIPVRLVNFSSESVTVHAGKTIATMMSARDAVCLVEGHTNETNSDVIDDRKREVLWKLVEGLETELNDEERELFFQLLPGRKGSRDCAWSRENTARLRVIFVRVYAK